LDGDSTGSISVDGRRGWRGRGRGVGEGWVRKGGVRGRGDGEVGDKWTREKREGKR